MVDTMKQQQSSDSICPAGIAGPDSRTRAQDVSGMAVLMVTVGVAALIGSWVFQAADLAELQGGFFGLVSLLIVVGLGLWHRMNWARCSAIVLFAYVIYAQMSSRWLQSDVPGLFIDSLRGVHDGGVAPTMSLSQMLPAASTSAAGLGLALCLALGWFMARLMSTPVRAEFLPSRTGQNKRNNTVKAST
jgi:hypothetical protein